MILIWYILYIYKYFTPCRPAAFNANYTCSAVAIQQALQNFEIWDLRSETWLTLIWLIWFDMVPLRLQVLLLVLLVLCCHFCATPSPQSFKISLIAEQSSTTAFTTIALAPCTHFVFGPWFFLWLVGHHDVSCQTNIVGPRFDSVTNPFQKRLIMIRRCTLEKQAFILFEKRQNVAP